MVTFRSVCAAVSLVVIVGCGGAAQVTPSPEPPSPAASTPIPATASPRATTAPTPAPSPAVELLAEDLATQWTDPLLTPGTLNVYAPTSGTDWPVVVMLHGQPTGVTKEFLNVHAQRVAALGFVVFTADWGHLPTFAAQPDEHTYADAVNAQVACAIAFVAANAPYYGGNPDTLIVFGHSGGANAGSVVIFEGTPPAATCRNDDVPLRAPDADALVLWDGNWFLDPSFDSALKADPKVFDLISPLSLLPRRPALPVVMLVSETPGPSVELPMPSDAIGPWLALRAGNPEVAALVSRFHPFDDGMISMSDMQPMFAAALRANGNPVTLTTIPGSTHVTFSNASWPVFLEAFEQALAAMRP